MWMMDTSNKGERERERERERDSESRPGATSMVDTAVAVPLFVPIVQGHTRPL